MKITLAGYNLDATLIEEARSHAEQPDAFTPETIAVAYARISRDPSPVSQLREKAIDDIEKARRSARNIVNKAGRNCHRLAMTGDVQRSRLALAVEGAGVGVAGRQPPHRQAQGLLFRVGDVPFGQPVHKFRRFIIEGLLSNLMKGPFPFAGDHFGSIFGAMGRHGGGQAAGAPPIRLFISILEHQRGVV